MDYKTTEIKYVEDSKEAFIKECGVLFKWRDVLMLTCPRCGLTCFVHQVVQIDSSNRATLMASVKCEECHAHFAVKKGKIKVLPEA